jgi:O-antigen/teichoic acid export membrane protein
MNTPERTRSRRRSSNIAWAGAVNLVGGATGSLIALVLAAMVGRSLGPDGAGTYFVAVAVFMIVSNMAELGADTGLVKFVAAARATGQPERIGPLVRIAVKPVVALALGLVLVVAVAAGLGLTVLDGLGGPVLVGGAALAVASSLNAVVVAVSRGYGDVVTYPLAINIALPAMRVAAVAAVLAAGGQVEAVVLAWMAPVVAVLIALVVVARTYVAESRRDAAGRQVGDVPALRREFWSFSAARAVAAAVEVLLEWVDVVLVAWLTSPTEAGIYAVVTRCARASEVLAQAMRIAVGPQAAAALARGAVAEASRIYSLTTAAMIWMGWPFFAALIVYADSVLSIFGPGFDEGVTSLRILSVAMAIALTAGTVQTIVLMGGRSSWQLADKSIALAVNVALNLALVPAMGIEGAAIAWAVTIVVDTSLVAYQVQRLMGVRPDVRRLATAGATALVAGAGPLVAAEMVWGSSLGAMLAGIGAAAAVYLVVGWFLRHRLGLVQLVQDR